MIQIIVEIKVKGNARKATDNIVEALENKIGFKLDIFHVEDMKEDTFSIVVKVFDDFYTILDLLDKDFKMKVIGAYDINGNQVPFRKKVKDHYKKDENGEDVYDYTEYEDDSSKNHTLTKWKNQIKTEENLTNEEAAQFQAGKIYGWNDKILN